MANHKSALKRNRQSLVRRERNRARKTKVKSLIRRIDEAIGQQAVDQAQQALQEATRLIQKTASKGTFHRNTASRKVSRLTKRVNNFINSQQSAS